MAPKIPAVIHCKSKDALEYELSIVRDGLELEETEDNWDKIANALLRLSAIAQGCTVEFIPQFVAAIKSMARPINHAIVSERSRLSGAATDFVTLLGTNLRRSFDPLMPHFIPSLLTQATKSNKIFISRAKMGLTAVAENVQSPALLPFLRLAVTDKSASLRLVAVDVVLICLNCYNPPDLESPARVDDIEAVIRTTARDASADVRKSSRKVFEAYKVLFPHRVDSFVAPLTPTMKKYLDIKAKSSAPSAPSAATSRPKPKPISSTTTTNQTTLKSSSSRAPPRQAEMIISRKRTELEKKTTQSEKQAAIDMPPPPPPQRAPSSGPVRPPPGMAVAPSRPMPHLTRPGLASNPNSAGFDAARCQPIGPSRPTAQRPASVTLGSSTHSERPKSPDQEEDAANCFDPTKSVPTSHLTHTLKSSMDAPRGTAKATEPPKVTHSRQSSKDDKGKQTVAITSDTVRSTNEQQKKSERKQIDLQHNIASKRANEIRRRELPTEKPSLTSSTSSINSNAHRPPSRTESRPPSRSDARPPSRSEVRSARLRAALTSSSSSSKAMVVPTATSDEGHHQPFRPSSRTGTAPEQAKPSVTEPEKKVREGRSAESAEQTVQERKERKARKEKEREKEKAIRSKKSVADLGADVGHDQDDDRVQKRQTRRHRQDRPHQKTEIDVAPVQPEAVENPVDADLQCILTVTAPIQSAADTIPDDQAAPNQPTNDNVPESVADPAPLPIHDDQDQVKIETHPDSDPDTGRPEGEVTVKPDVTLVTTQIEAVSAQEEADTPLAVVPDKAIVDAETISEKTPVKNVETKVDTVPTKDLAKTPTMHRTKAGRNYASPPPVIRPLLIKKNRTTRRIASGHMDAELFMPKLGSDADAESDEEKAQLFASDVPLPDSPEPDRAFLLPLEQQMCTPAPLRTAVTMKYAGGVAATPISKLLQSIQHGFDVSVIGEISEEDEDAENLALPYIPPQESQSLGSLASSDMVFSMFGASQGDIHGFPFMDRAINDFKGLTIGGDDCDNRLPLIPLIDN